MFIKKSILTALALCVAASEVPAVTFTNYASSDVLIGFRKSGGLNDLVVNAGPISNLTNAPAYQRIAITNYTGSQLLIGAGGVLSTNSTVWSAMAFFGNNPASAPSVASRGTLFLTRARSSTALLDMTQPWEPQTKILQFNAVSWIKTLAPGALVMLSPTPYNTNSTPTAVIEPDANGTYTDGNSYAGVMGADFNFNGESVAYPENTTTNNFVTAGKVSRSDFWRIPPSDSGIAPEFLGVFDFNTNGSMTFIADAYPPTVATVTASSITSTSAKLNCTVNPNGESASYYLQYGLTDSYGSSTVTNLVGTTNGAFGVTVTGLTPGTTYNYRAVGYNQYGLTNAVNFTFTTTGGGAVTTPVITAFYRSNNISFVSFTTGNSGTYTLRSTNNVGLSTARTNWPAISSVSGNGLTNTLQDTSPATDEFYTITAQ